MLQKLQKYSSKIIVIMALMLPFLDMYKASIGNGYELFGISLVEIFNFIYVSILLMLLLAKLIINKEKIFSFKFILMFFLIFIFIVGHVLSLFIIGNPYFNVVDSPTLEVYYIVRSYILPLLVLLVYMRSDISSDDIISTLSTLSFIYSVIMVITNIFGIAYIGYAANYETNVSIRGGITSWFTTDISADPDSYTSKGLFYSTNQLSIMLGSLLFISAFYTLHKDSIKYYLSFFVKVLALFMLSTKTGFGAIIFSISAIFIYQIFMKIFYKKSEFTKKSIIFLVYLIFIIGIYNFSPLKYKLNNYIKSANDFSSVEVDDSIEPDCMSDKTIFMKRKYALSIERIMDKSEVSNIEKHFMASYMSECPTYFNVLKEYVGFYPVEENFEFWYEFAKSSKSESSNFRRVKKNIYNDYIKKHNNVLDILFGIGYISNFSYLEIDFYAQFVWFGLIGTVALLSPYVILIFKGILNLLFNFKTKFNKFTFAYSLSVLYFLFISVLAGHLFGLFIPSVVLALTIKGFYEELNLNKELIDNKITFLLLHLGFGGVESATINTANALSDKYEIEIISFYKLENDQVKSLNPNIKLKYLYNGGPNKDDFNNALSRKQLFKVIKEGIKAVHILILKKYLIIREIENSDSKYIVSTRNEYSILLSKYGRKNTIKIAQEHRHHNGEKKYINNIKYKFSNIDYLFALTKSLKDDYEKFLANNKKTKVVIVPNMIYKPDKKSDLKNKNIISISRLHPGKRIDELINIFSKIENKKSKLYIVGAGEEEENLKNLVEEKKLTDRVIFTGYKNKVEMEEYILDSCVFAMTSITEGLPMVLLEAMGYGIPCIAYRTESGVADIIDNEINGYIIENRSEEDYIKTLNSLLKDDKKISKLSVNAIKKVDEFSKEAVTKLWIDILDGE